MLYCLMFVLLCSPLNTMVIFLGWCTIGVLCFVFYFTVVVPLNARLTTCNARPTRRVHWKLLVLLQ